jgi:hypothetical protein
LVVGPLGGDGKADLEAIADGLGVSNTATIPWTALALTAVAALVLVNLIAFFPASGAEQAAVALRSGSQPYFVMPAIGGPAPLGAGRHLGDLARHQPPRGAEHDRPGPEEVESVEHGRRPSDEQGGHERGLSEADFFACASEPSLGHPPPPDCPLERFTGCGTARCGASPA